MTTRALDLVEDWPARRLAVAVVAADGSTEMTGAHDEIFALASLTKLETAMAVLVAAEEGTVDLDEPVTEAGATVADLLGHSSGIAPDSPEQLSSPRSRRIYSTAAYDTVASLVSDRAAMPFARYLHEAVFAPLGMRHSRLLGSAGADAVGTITDLIRLVAAWRAPRLVHDSTLARATTAWLPELDGVLPGYGRQRPNPWGLGPEIRGDKQPHWTAGTNSPATFGHFGRAGTMLWVDPRAEVALVALTDLPFGSWAVAAWPTLSEAVLDQYGT